MANLTYRLNERPAGKALWLSSLQWFVFTLANVITVPLVLGHSLGFDEAGVAAFTGRTLLLCGIIGILQVTVGHRYPIIEGPAGMWWGVFLVLIQMHRETGGTTGELLRQLEFGLMAASLVFILLGVLGIFDRVKRLFTPAVTGTFLILLTVQVSKSMLQGVLGIGFDGGTTVSGKIAILSLVLISITVGIMMRGKGIWRNISVLIGLSLGWGAYAVLGMVHFPAGSESVVAVPAPFPYGAPMWNLGIVVTTVMTAVILLSNLIASIQIFAEASEHPAEGKAFGRGSLITGVGTFLAGMWGVVGAVPLTAAASLVSLTGIASRLPFLLSSVCIAVLGLFPGISRLFVTIPAPVGYAVLFTVFGQLIGFGLRDMKRMALDQRDIFTVALPLLCGMGLTFIPGEAWSGLPPVFGYLFGNGLIVGVVLVIVLEHIVFRRRNAA